MTAVALKAPSDRISVAPESFGQTQRKSSPESSGAHVAWPNDLLSSDHSTFFSELLLGRKNIKLTSPTNFVSIHAKDKPLPCEKASEKVLPSQNDLEIPAAR